MAPSLEHYQNDQWTLSDDFGLAKVGDQVAKMALQVQPPFTIGVTGKWGAGKTSILRRGYATLGGSPMQQERLLAPPKVESTDHTVLCCSSKQRQDELPWEPELYHTAEVSRCVWYSPWQHQNEDNPLIPLLQEIHNQYTSWCKTIKNGKEIGRQAALAGLTVLERVIDGALSLKIGKNVKIATGTTEAVQKAWQSGQSTTSQPSDGQRFQLLFEDAIETVLSAFNEDGLLPDNARLVIFIDDLDRCEESVIVRLLEVIKLYLSVERCVFVLGLDDSAVINALGRCWKRSDDLNREYLEKLFQARLPVPLPRSDNVTTGITNQLQQHKIAHASLLAEDIEQLLEPNPRKIKNFVNGFCASWAIMQAQHWINETKANQTLARKFLLFHYIQQYHRNVWRILERQPEALPYLTAVLNAAGIVDQEVNVSAKLDPLAQNLLMEMFRREFSHVLPSNEPRDDKSDRHGNETLEQAVDKFLQRQDRKRSDEYLRKLYLDLIDANEILHNHFLYAEQPVIQAPQ